MVDMTASGWECPSGNAGAAVQILDKWRPWGPGGRRMALVQLNLTATNFGNGAHVYPGEGIPAPAPSLVGFRECVDYIIPLGPFVGATAIGRSLVWGSTPPTYGVSGGTVSTGNRIRVQGLGGATPSGGPTYQLEAVSTLAATDLFTTNVYQTNAIFVGR